MAVTDALVLVAASVAAGGVSAVTGFGIGSLLTPVFALDVDMRLAVAAVSVPHLAGTALRGYLLGGGVDRRVLWSFGLTSAAGGLAGALLHARLAARSLAVIFGALLLFAAASELSGLARRMQFRGWVAWVAGALSGLLGGLVGNQGGIRSAALLGFDLSKRALVATATAIALFVDGARVPVYLATVSTELRPLWAVVTVATGGVLLGTVGGSRLFERLPEIWFRRVLAAVLAVLGTVMIGRAARP